MSTEEHLQWSVKPVRWNGWWTCLPWACFLEPHACHICEYFHSWMQQKKLQHYLLTSCCKPTSMSFGLYIYSETFCHLHASMSHCFILLTVWNSLSILTGIAYSAWRILLSEHRYRDSPTWTGECVQVLLQLFYPRL